MMDATVAACDATVNGMQPGVRKRGAKPKYKFMTAREAVAHRFPPAYLRAVLLPASCLCSTDIWTIEYSPDRRQGVPV